MRLGLAQALDKEVWNFVRENDYLVVTKDADFSELSLMWGFPPKVVWIRRGNCSTREIETMLRKNYAFIEALSTDHNTGILMLF